MRVMNIEVIVHKIIVHGPVKTSGSFREDYILHTLRCVLKCDMTPQKKCVDN